MKAAVILFFIFAYFQVEVLGRAIEDVTPLEPEEAECVDELKLNKNEIERLNSPEIAPENNDNFNKFLGCYYQKMGWQDSNGNIDYDSFKTAMADAIAAELENETPAVQRLVNQMMLSTVDQCQANPPPKGNSNGQTAARVQNCVVHKLNDILNEA